MTASDPNNWKRVWLDDERDPPDDTWHHVRTAHGCIMMIAYAEPGEIEVLSLDHDLGHRPFPGQPERTGYSVLNWIEELLVKYPDSFGPKVPKEIRIHSANPVGHQNMRRAIASIERRLGRTCAEGCDCACGV